MRTLCSAHFRVFDQGWWFGLKGQLTRSTKVRNDQRIEVLERAIKEIDSEQGIGQLD